MKKFCLVVFLFFPLVGICQISILDEKFGALGIKLEENITNYDFIKKCEKPSDKKFNFHYFYLGQYLWNEEFYWGSPSHYVDLEKIEKKKFLNTKIEKILIETYNDKISEIIIVLNDNIHNSVRIKYSQLYDLFGPSNKNYDPYTNWNVDENGKTKQAFVYWFGEKVSMGLISFHLDNEVNRSIGNIITISSKYLNKLKREKEENEREKNAAKRKKELIDNW